MTEPQTVKQKRDARQREVFTFVGFGALLTGLWLGWGLALALVVGGSLVFGFGMFGILRG